MRNGGVVVTVLSERVTVEYGMVTVAVEAE